jgi:hypothetical protein
VWSDGHSRWLKESQGRRWKVTSEEEKSRWDAWRRRKERSEEEESPDELKRKWAAWKRWKARSEEEKGKERVLNLDEIPREGETLHDIIESGEIPEELRESIQALAKAVEPTFERLVSCLAEPFQTGLQSHLDRIAESAGSISSGRFNWVDVENVFTGQQVTGILEEMLEEDRKARIEAGRAREDERRAKERRERKENWRYSAALGVTIVIALVGWAIAIGLAIVQQRLGG